MSDIQQARKWAKEVDEGYSTYMTDDSRAAIKVLQSLPDQWIDAEKLRQIIDFQGTSISEEARKDLESLIPAPSLPTLADMTPDERQSCVGMWAEWKHGEGREKLAVIEVMNTVRDFAGLTIPGVRFLEVPRHRLGDVTPRFDLPRAWMPDGSPVEMEVQVSEVAYGRVYEGSSHDRVTIPEDTKVRRFVGEWEATDE